VGDVTVASRQHHRGDGAHPDPARRRPCFLHWVL